VVEGALVGVVAVEWMVAGEPVTAEGAVAGEPVFGGLVVEYFEPGHPRPVRSGHKLPAPEAAAPYFAAVDSCC